MPPLINPYILNLENNPSSQLKENIMDQISQDDLKTALTGNVINEQQFASILHIAQKRQQAHHTLHGEDEPFAIFLGFSEIFISIGLCILFAGLVGILTLLDSLVAAGAIVAVLSLGLSHYFIKIRRMVLPSIVSSSALTLSSILCLVPVAIDLFSQVEGDDPYLATLILPLAPTLCLLVWMYRKYKLPYLTFLIGVTGLGMILSIAGILSSSQQAVLDFDSLMDLSVNPIVAGSWLLFGLIALGFGLYFDCRDPYRVGNPSKSAFWLHLLSGPSLLNVIALNIYYEGDTTSYILTTLLLCLFVIIALIIDRRSFISAGIIYMSFVVSWATKNLGMDADYISLFVLGLIITALATWWHKWRSALMNALPNFPYKEKLPPY